LASLIPESKIAEVRQAANIAEIISEVVVLKPTGKNLMGVCPFHADGDPSFSVNPDRQFFYCFGCGDGGDVFQFMMKHYGMTFHESLVSLASRYAITLPEKDFSPEENQRLRERETIFDLNQEAARFFQAMLREPAGQEALNYLSSRQIQPDTLDRFQIGYAPPMWDALARHFSERRVSREFLEKAGLVIARQDSSGHYDRFRNRIMLPILDRQKRVMAFGGRVMDDQVPKYLNSPETSVFSKRRSVYGLENAGGACRGSGKVFIVEGYFDRITLCQFGIENVVATLGTALTPDHVATIRGVASQAILVFDSDPAGVRAARRGIEIFQKARMPVSIMVLPEGHDPDSFVRQSGAEAFLKLAERAMNPIAFLTQEAINRNGRSVDGILKTLAELTEPMAAVRDPIARSLYIREIAETMGLSESQVLERMGGAARNAPSSGKHIIDQGSGGLQNPAFGGRRAKLEKQIIAMMLQFPAILPEISHRGLLSRFEDRVLLSIAEGILAHASSGGQSIADLLERLSDEPARRITASLAIQSADNWTPDTCLQVIRRFEADCKSNETDLLNRIDLARKQNDAAQLAVLMQEKLERARARQSKPAYSEEA